MYYKIFQDKISIAYLKAKPILVQAGKYVIKKVFSGSEKNPAPTVLEEVNLAHQEWQDAKQAFDYASRDSVDYAVYRLNAAERKYIFLLNEAKTKGINAWIYAENDEEKQVEC